jgi:hypothetical protein
MPRFDGTGPKGRGPMSGSGRGFCLMRMPETPGEAATGFAGLAGRPVTVGDDPGKMDIASLHERLRDIQAALDDLKGRLANLEAAGGDGAQRPEGHSA